MGLCIDPVKAGQAYQQCVVAEPWLVIDSRNAKRDLVFNAPGHAVCGWRYPAVLKVRDDCGESGLESRGISRELRTFLPGILMYGR